MQNSQLSEQVLVINCGSSSVKFSLIHPLSGQTVINALAERLNLANASLTIKLFSKQENEPQQFNFKLNAPFNHIEAINTLVVFLTEQQLLADIAVVGHRIVHGGENYNQPTLITPDVLSIIESLAELAPLHNPANVVGIKAAQKTFSNLPQVAVFDTAFHQSMPKKAYLYPIPYGLYQQHKIRRYGFHGTSHYYVANKTAQMINKPLAQCNFISAHLGNGCSITAIKNGQSIDTSLGFTPLEGVMMGTRSGDVDPGIIFYLVEHLGYSLSQVNHLLNNESGLLGISGISNDCRELEQAMTENVDQAKIALEMFCYRIAKKISSFMVCFNALDGLIFTGGIGENSQFIRASIIKQLALLNFSLCPTKNAAMRFGQTGLITTENSCAAWVVPTNEEWVIAEQSHRLVTAITQ